MDRRRRTKYKDAYNAASKFKDQIDAITEPKAEFGGRGRSAGNFDFDIEAANQANKKYPKGTLRGIATPPPGYEFTEDNKLVKRGGGESTP
jgi:hypothetical protein